MPLGTVAELADLVVGAYSGVLSNLTPVATFMKRGKLQWDSGEEAEDGLPTLRLIDYHGTVRPHYARLPPLTL
jgi:hypothetical protein